MKQYIKTLDYKLLVVIVILCAIGAVMVYSASSIVAVMRFGIRKDYFFTSQVTAMAVGGILFFIFSLLPHQLLKKRLFIFINVVITFGLLAAVLIFGATHAGVNRWIDIGGFRFQPSEFVRVAVIVMLASTYSKKQPYINDFWRGLAPPLMYAILIFLGVYLQRDLGSALIILGITGCMVIGVGMKPSKTIKIVVIGTVAAILLGILAYFFILEDYQLARFVASYDPFSAVGGAGFQPINAYMAMTNGGLFGVGLGNSIQKFGRLPEAHTDYIIAIIAEELGFIGVCVVLGGLGFIALRSLVIAKRCPDPFGSLLAIGIASFITLQTFVNIGGMTGITPMTGVPLPLISFGGTSVVATLFALGILMSVSRYTKAVTLKERAKEGKTALQLVK